MKHCSRCQQDKPLSEFHTCKVNPDGYRGQCKRCRNEVSHQGRVRRLERAKRAEALGASWEWIRELAQVKRGSHGFF